MKKKVKILVSLLVSLLLISTMSLFGCGVNVSSEKDPSSITVWIAAPYVEGCNQILKLKPNDKRALLTKWVVDRYKELHPEIDLKLKDKGWSNTLNTELIKAIAANTVPDIAVGEIYVPTYIANNHFMPLDLGDIGDDILDQTATYGKGSDGKWYAAPAFTGTFGLTINKNVLRGANIINDKDETIHAELKAASIDALKIQYWEDLLKVCELVKATYNAKGDTVTGGMLLSNTSDGASWRNLAFQRTAGGEISKDNKTMVMNTPENKKAYDMIRKLSKTVPDGSLATTTEQGLWEQYLFSNKAAYMVEGIDSITRSYAFLKEGDIISIPLPTFKENGVKSNVLVGTSYYSIMKKKNNQKYEQSLEFIKFLMSKEVQLKCMEYDMRVPTRKSVLVSDEIKKISNYDKMRTYINPLVDENCKFDGGIPSFMKNPATVWQRYKDFVGDVYGSAVPIADLLNTAQTKMTNAYND